MNAKKCKRARRLARKLTAGQPDRVFTQSANPKKPPAPWPTGRVVIRPEGTIKAHPSCTRGVYKLIKNWLRAGATMERIERENAHVKTSAA